QEKIAVWAGHEHVGRVERAEVLGLLVRPAEGGEGPEPRREPRVEDVLVLTDGPAAARPLVQVEAARVDVLRRVAVVAVPHGDAMSPPQLTRDVPVADVLE